MMTALISAIALGQSLLAAHLLARRIRHSNVYLPLAVFFAANAVAQLCFILREPIFDGEYLGFIPELTLFKLIVEISLPPLMWLYVRELTSQFARGWRRTDILHFFVPIASSLVVALICFARQKMQESIPAESFIDILNGVLNVVALVQFGVYVVFVMRRLRSYRRKLMDLFASTTDMEMRWFRWALLLIVLSILLELSAEILRAVYQLENPYTPWNGFLRVILVWFFAAWGLRQRPDLKIEATKTYPGQVKPRKYEKSALTSEQIDDVSNKISHAVEVNKLYQDPNLSLRILSDEIGVLPNYVSQALNMKMNETFFDYVNRLRVKDAMSRLEQSEQTVLAISAEVGFNSRSSFYSAFKKVTGKTPTAYRKAAREQ